MTGRRQRVAMIVPSLRPGGLERLVRDLCLAMSDRDVETAVYCVGGLGEYATDLTAAGIRVEDCREGRWRIRGYPGRLIRALRTFNPDVLHAHSGTWYAAAVAQRLLGESALVYTEHGRYPPEPWGRSLVERWCRTRTAALVTVSQGVADYLRRFLRLSRTPRVIHNGIDLTPYRTVDHDARAGLRSSWGIGPDDVVAIVVGRLVPVKNHAGLLRALERALRTTGRLRLVVLGRGPLEADLRRQASASGLQDHITFLGFRRDVPACLAAADLFVMPSTTEGQPVSLLEAMATGLPIVASQVGGIPETLGDPPAGVLLAPDDTEGWSRVLVELAGDPRRRAALAQSAGIRAEDFDLDTFADGYGALYREVARTR